MKNCLECVIITKLSFIKDILMLTFHVFQDKLVVVRVIFEKE